jgi:hypothetical protein
MVRMDRAGRKRAMMRVLMQQQKRKVDCWMTTGMVARRMGLRSSTKLKKWLMEIALGTDGFMWREDRGKREYAYIVPEQLLLPNRTIIINGKSHTVANWVLPNGKAL